MTLVFDDAAGFFIGRTANWDGLDVSFKLPQYVTSSSSTGTSYNLTLNSYDNSSGGWSNTAVIAGFEKQSVNGTDSFTFTDSTGSVQTLYCIRVKIAGANGELQEGTGIVCLRSTDA